MIQIQPYNLTVRYSPGSDIPLPDTLSRLHLFDTDEMLQADIEVFVHTIINRLPISHPKLQEIKDKTKSDVHLKQLKTTLKEGRTSLRNRRHPEIRLYRNIMHELSAFDGMLLKGPQIIIPVCLLK
ncbi:hypothetical protein QYM36_005849 [Artemia franciscana]|uniref:Uncharacterized protein n=1 Tax=Artemia franciscana TaxID=6661 RepID=A0AA88HWZ0_ARTSF|nr:hypothetical protein QYM36_005849 [Artemia franciscana]